MAIIRPVSSRRGAKRLRKAVKARAPWSAKRTQSLSLGRSRIPGIIRPDFGFPDKLVTKLRYVENYLLTGAVGVPGTNVFRMNSAFDPDLSGVGHQPMYYDQFAGAVGTSPYSRYRVISSKITVRFAFATGPATQAANVGPVVVGLQTSSTSGLYASNLSGLCEASNSTWTWLGDKAGGNNHKTLTATYYPTRDLGVDQGDDTVAAAYNGNPTQVFHAMPWKIDTIGSAAIQALVEIVYKVEFFDRNEVAQS